MRRKRSFLTGHYLSLTLSIVFLSSYVNTGTARGGDPPAQYIAVNGVPSSDADFKEIAEMFGNSSGDISIGIGFIISYLRQPPEVVRDELLQYLALSAKYDMPIIIQIDGESWWQDRPDLWNWWDPDRPGFDPDNRYNVEWTGWSPDSAVKIGWRNWGRQLRVLPMPNLMSPEYRQACHREMSKLIPEIVNWWHELPPEKKHLFIGVKVGWESSIGVNNWYYPNGNELLDEPEANDPTYGLDTDQLPGRGVTTIGYSSVSSAGIAESGPMKEEYLTEVTRRHLEDYSRMAWKMGIPRDHIFTHAGGWSQGETLFTAAVNDYSCPGWSFYKHAMDVTTDVTVMNTLEDSDAPYWGAVEYLLMGNKTAEQWYSALRTAFDTDRLRYLCIYNWRGIKDNQNALDGIQQLIND
jgi:hypothetical protein